MADGLGTFTGSDGSKYIGELKGGKLNGQGKVTNANGDNYVGEFKDGLPNGYGIFQYVSGDKYVGEFENGVGSGYGTLTCANGIKYSGEFKNGQPSGQGILIMANGDKYVGEFKEGQATGNGIYYNEKLSGEKMTIDSLGEALKGFYNNAPKGEKAIILNVFGIKYADDILNNGYALKDIIKNADIPETYQNEIKKGIKLAKYVINK